MHRIFISYARKDGEAVEEIRTAFLGLAQGGHVSVFKDDRSLVAGDDWQEKLWGELREADVVLACLSHYYFASRNCRSELDEALAKGVLVLPCIVSECDFVPHAVHDLQRAARGGALAEVWADWDGRSRWLGQLVRDVLQAIQQGGLTAEGDELDAIDSELVASAFELAGRLSPADAVAGLRRLRRTDPAAAREVERQLAELTGGPAPTAAAPPARPPRAIELTPVAVEPAAPKKSEPSSPWTRYWRNRLDRTVPWSTLTGHAARAELSDGDHAYLVVGEPAQQPHLLVSRICSFLPGNVSDEPRRPAVIVVPFPDPDFAATDAYDVQRQLAAALCEHPEFPDLHPTREPRGLVASAARRRPLVFVIGQPLRRSAERELPALERFFTSIEQLLGPAGGRWPVRIVVVVEEPRGGGMHRRLYQALSASPIAFEPFEPLHFPPWAEVYEQLRDDEHFAGLNEAQLARVRDDYNVAVHEVSDLTELADRLLTTLERLKESS